MQRFLSEPCIIYIPHLAKLSFQIFFLLTGCRGPCMLAALQTLVEKLRLNMLTDASDLFKNILSLIISKCVCIYLCYKLI